MNNGRAAAAAVIALVLAGLTAPGASATHYTLVTPTRFVALLQSGHEFSHVEIRGDLDLEGLTVRQPLKCKACRFDGAVIARDAIFERTIDLTNADFRHGVDFEGAELHGSVFFTHAAFRGPADFSSASLDDIGNFEEVKFDGPARFASTRFHADGLFRRAMFQTVTFADATFGRTARFGIAMFERDALFDGASFSDRADFRGATFFQSASLRDTDFAGAGEFTEVHFEKGANFVRAHFASDAAFRFASFGGFEPASSPSPVIDFFDEVVVAGKLDFSHATFYGDVSIELASASSISFESAIFRARLDVFGISTDSLVLDLAAVDHIPLAGQRQALKLIQSGAKSRGDFGLANDAYYRLREAESRSYGWALHALDVVFYGEIAGYLVRPEHPLAALLILAALLSLLRMRRSRSEPVSKPRSASRIRRLAGVSSSLGNEFLSTVTSGLRRSGKGDDSGPRGLELLAYRLLLLCAALGLYANPAFRDLVDLVK